MINLATSTTFCFCGVSISEEDTKSSIKCSSCPRRFHRACLRIKGPADQYFCFICYLQQMDPLHPVQKCLFLGVFVNRGRQKSQFYVDVEQSKIGDSFIELRSVRLQEDPHYEITWPDACQVLLNKRTVGTFKPLGASSSVKRRRDSPKQISNCRLETMNTLRVKYLPYQKNTFKVANLPHLIGVYIVRKTTKENLIKQLLAQIPSKQYSLDHLRKFLSTNQDDLQIEKSQVSTVCPYTSSLIQIPARGEQCRHLGCFDLSNIIWANSKFPRWKCPICRLSCHNLIVDPLLYGIIKTNQQVKAIKFLNDKGEYQVIKETDNDKDQEIDQTPRKKKKENPVEVHELDNNSELTQREFQMNDPFQFSQMNENLYKDSALQLPILYKANKKSQPVLESKSSEECVEVVLASQNQEQQQDQLVVIGKDQFNRETQRAGDYYKKKLKTLSSSRFVAPSKLSKTDKNRLYAVGYRSLRGVELSEERANRIEQ